MSSSKLTSQSRLELTCVWQEALPTPDGWPNQKRQDDWHLSWISSICPSLNLSPVRRKGKKKLINTPDRWLQRFSLSSAQSSTGCHSPLAAQPHLIPKGDRYSLSGFQLSEESKALPVVHSEGFWQEAVVCFWSAAHRSSGSRGSKRQGGGRRRRKVALWRDLPVKTDSREGYTQEIIKQRLAEGLSCSAAVKGPWWCDTRLSWWMWLLALVIDSPILFDTGRLSSTGSTLNGGLAFERKPRDLLAD